MPARQRRSKRQKKSSNFVSKIFNLIIFLFLLFTFLIFLIFLLFFILTKNLAYSQNILFINNNLSGQEQQIVLANFDVKNNKIILNKQQLSHGVCQYAPSCSRELETSIDKIIAVNSGLENKFDLLNILLKSKNFKLIKFALRANLKKGEDPNLDLAEACSLAIINQTEISKLALKYNNLLEKNGLEIIKINSEFLTDAQSRLVLTDGASCEHSVQIINNFFENNLNVEINSKLVEQYRAQGVLFLGEDADF